MFMSSYGMERFLGLLICRVFQRGRFLLGLMKCSFVEHAVLFLRLIHFTVCFFTSFFEHCIPIICKVNFLQENKVVKSIIRKSKFPQNPKRSVRFSGKRTKRSVQKRKARNTQKAETKVL